MARSRAQLVTRTLFLLWVGGIFMTCHCQSAGDRRTFPPLHNVASGRPILTVPADSTCGIPTRNAYCQSDAQVEHCVQDFCFQSCAQNRTTLPTFVNLLVATSSGYSVCVESDTINVRPGSDVGQYATAIVSSGVSCHLTPTQSPSAGVNGSFTVTSWIWIDQEKPGILLEKSTSSGGSILRVEVSPFGVNVTFTAQTGLQKASLTHPIGQRNWTHLAVQVYRRSVSFFINGFGEDYRTTDTVLVSDIIADSSGSFRLGQNADGTGQYIGKIQDIRYYSTTLSNREVQEVYSGTLPPVRIQSNCRCPPARPRVKSQNTLRCVANGIPESAASTTLRISENSHPVEFANDDNMNTMWISKFQRDVALEIDLEDQFEVFTVVLNFYSPLPKAVTIERQLVTGSPGFQAWQYYAQNCTTYFGMDSNGALTSQEDVNCIQIESNSGFGGSITFTVLSSDRIGYEKDNFFSSPTLQQFVQAAKVRVHLQDHNMQVISNIRHEYFSLREIVVNGRCGCNGHAESCSSDTLPYRCVCSAESHTQGDRCEQCQPLYNNKPFRQGDIREAYNCQYCECYNHSDSCVYNSTLDPSPDSWTDGGGGVCVNCQHNTEGQNCEVCIDGYFRPLGKSLSDADVCSPCTCNASGTVDGQTLCDKVGGQCPCKANVTGRACNQCSVGTYSLQEDSEEGCIPCGCNLEGAVNGNPACNQVTGQCFCKQNVQGKQCNSCQYGFYNLQDDNPNGCMACNCNPVGSTSMACNPDNGQCQCKGTVEGLKCHQCVDGFYNFSSGCLPCNCNDTGTEAGTTCDKDTGQCVCKSQTAGRQCNECRPGSFSFGNSPTEGCEPCLCLKAGVPEGNVDCTNGCVCKENVEGTNCNRCKANFFNLTRENVLGCDPCNCDPSGVNSEGPCHSTTGQCICLTSRQGLRCDDCVSGYYKDLAPAGGCLPCSCDPDGEVPGTTCDSQTGQCSCRTADGVAGHNCDQCAEGFYNFKAGRCEPCNCLEAGITNSSCNRVTGDCQCKLYVTGRQCDTCVQDASDLSADNEYGCSKTPSQQPPPVHDPLTPTSMNISWLPPDFPNGVILRYRLFRDDVQVYEGQGRDYIDTDLQPYTLYTYEVEASNAVGSVRSAPVTFRTNPGIPSADMVLQVKEIQVASASFFWNPPSKMNGPLLEYQLVSYNLENVTDLMVEWTGNDTQAELKSLRPYHRYNMTVKACTDGGCSESNGLTFTTQTAPPTDMQPPTITPISSTQLLVEWEPPLNPNGVITFYELWIRGLPGPDGHRNPVEQRIFYPSGQYDPLNPDQSILDPPATSFNVTQLRAYTAYEFQVLAQNEAGRAASPWTVGRTKETFPVFMPAPAIIGITGTELNVSWTQPSVSEARGNITTYRLFQNVATNLTADPFAAPATWQLVAELDGQTRHYVVRGLTPYATYDFRLQACNNIGCVNSTASSGRTLPAAPEGMAKPTVDSYNSTVMNVRWRPPTSPNGPTPTYTVQKTNIALSYPASVVRGTRFPGGGFYAFPAETLPQNVDFTGIRFEFRLKQPSGLLFFAASENQQEYVAVLFSNGRPRFMFDTQGQCETAVEVNVSLPENVNLTSLADGQVHTLQVVRRHGNNGSVLVDQIYSGSGQITDKDCRHSTVIGHTTELYIGGVPQDFILRRNEHRNSPLRKVIGQSFQGCIHKVEILKQMYPFEVWEELRWENAVSYELAFLNWQGCPINLGPGIHFMGKGYAALPRCSEEDCLLEGDFDISFRMRTSLHTGLLLMAHGGPGIYLLAYLRNDSLVWEFQNDTVKTAVHYTHTDPTATLCDGNWHTVVFTKLGQQGSISVDGGPAAVNGDPSVAMAVPILSHIFVGGVKPDSDMSAFLQTNQIDAPSNGFGGCLAALTVDEENKLQFRDLVNVNLDGCPPFHAPKDTCEDSLITDVYTGTDTTAFDYGLLPYTDYIYRVIAENSVGEVSSPWGYGRTREGAPVGVGPPTHVRVLSGYDVEVKWNEPQSTSGLLTKTIILAYNLQDPDQPPVTREVLDVNVEAVNMTDLVPDTDYRFKISACTSGGCTESVEGKDAHTLVEAPEEVMAPSAVSTDTTLQVFWDPPAKPNGNITGYFLFQDGVEIYTGGEQQFLVTGLRVYTAYQFYVQACTTAGCTTGPSVTLSTAQLPPTEVQPPTLTVLGARSVEVKWETPTQLNGVLERFLVYVSAQEGELGEVVYNSTDFFLTYAVPDLQPGTTYFFSVGACTGGGCTVSNSSVATTAESSPEGIADPVVNATSSSQLVVTWTAPQLPNGVITSYVLYHNDKNVTEGLIFRHEVNGLSPYSRHVFRLQVCTAQGCAFSAEVEARTKEAAPEGTLVLTASIKDARTVSVHWTRPSDANGQLFFDVFFQGLFYADPENWNYTTVTDRRSLFRDAVSYTAMDIGPLVPLSDYNVQVNASNTMGFVLSNVVALTMPAGSPDGMKPPSVHSDTPQSLVVTWDPVGRVNALEEVAYVLQFRQKEGDIIVDEFGATTTLTYSKKGLLPFTSYQFRVVASNSKGSTPSTWVANSTLQDRPSGVYPPIIAEVQSRFIRVEWSAPVRPNGIITQYRLYQNRQLREELSGNVSSYVAGELTPFEEYSFQLEACTEAGCTLSDDSSAVFTLKTIPDGIAAPLLRALTPTMIQVQWAQPTGPNGIISSYILERREANVSDVTVVVATFLPTDPKKYLDQSPELSPFMTYSYRVKVVNDAGTGEGPWANVTTSSSRPAGVMPPALTVLNSTTIRVTWRAPLQPNGVIESYVLEWEGGREETRNTSQFSLTLTGLVPFREYSVTLTACTSGGCTESAPTTVRTNTTVPSGQSPPSVTAISRSAVSALWQPPSGPNGPNLRYELARRKIRQPLDETVTEPGSYVSVYMGTSLFYEDQGLTMFTTYVYRVTVFNDVGQTISADSEEVTTFGGNPQRAAEVSATPLSHLAVLVTWSMPDPVDLQGEVQTLTLTAENSQGVVSVAPPVGGADNFTLTGLTPSSTYTVLLTITIFGGASVTSDPVTVTTLDGAPEGVPKPVLAVLSTTSLRVTWLAPAQSNGKITTYNLVLDGELIPTNSSTPGSKVIYDLQPFTVYDIQVEACTVFRCARSESVFGTTAEALPLGVAPPVVTPLNSTAIQVDWRPPSRPNGVILRYDVWRRTMQSCSQVPDREVDPEDSKCTYVECSVLESICGTSCFFGASKVCCEGEVHDKEEGYDCCGTSYIPRPDPNTVCCAGKFHPTQVNFTCCGSRYVQVLAGEKCCPSPVEDRVSVGPGDSCCGGVPYDSSGAQFCCGGELVSSYNRTCCGRAVVAESAICCGDGDAGLSHPPQSGFTCCGQQYLATDTSLCCVSDTGHAKVHFYESAEAKLAANEVCCGLETISAGLSCCNYMGFNPATQTCADSSSLLSGCGTGTVCPLSQAGSARCNRCDFNTTTTQCGAVWGHVTSDLSPPDNTSACTAGEDMVFSGLDLSFVDGSLSPDSRYRYSLRVINSAGTTGSDFVEGRTLEAAPAGVAPPTTRIDPEHLYIIYLSWTVPQSPNGEITHYTLTRDGVELFRGLQTEFTDDGNILPYRSYSYVLTACTKAGCTNSPAVQVASAQGVPEEVPAPGVRVLGPTILQVSIQAPGRPNGEVTHYTVHITQRPEKPSVTTPQDIRVEGLEPYTLYTVYVEVCTAVGCAYSPDVNVTTAEGTPQGVDTPTVVVMSATTVDVFWKAPDKLNGQLRAYTLFLSDVGGQRTVYNGSELSARVENLIPGRTYAFVLGVSTNGGRTDSPSSSLIMPLRTPLQVPPPHTVTVESATEIKVFWDPVNSTEGPIGQYRVLLNVGEETEMKTGVGTALSVTLSGLKPFTVYKVRLQACLEGESNGCGTSGVVNVTTWEAPPEGQAAPRLAAIASDGVRIEWDDPTSPNGIIRYFRIFQRTGGSADSDILINQVSGDTHRYIHSGPDLKPYSVYQYGVMAFNSKGSTGIKYASVRTLPAPPAGLEVPSVTRTGAYSVALEWTPPLQPNGVISTYNVYYQLVGVESAAEGIVTVDGNTTDTSVSGLQPHSQYQLWLEAVNTKGSAVSAKVPVSTEQASPSGLQPFSVEKIDSGKAVVLTWDPPSKPNGVITTYRIYERSDQQNAIYKGVSRLYLFQRLQPYTEYFVRQEACTIVGCTVGKEESFYTAEVPPEALPIPTVGTVMADSAVIRWSRPLNANGKILSYEVYRRSTPLRRRRQAEDSGLPGELVFRTLDTDQDSYEYNDTALEPYTQYEYKVRASNSQGFTDSPWQTIQTKQAAPEGVTPPDVSYVEGNVNWLNVTWSPPVSPNGVLQSYRLQQNSSIPLSLPPDGPLYYMFRELQAFTWYSFTLTVCSGGGCTSSDPKVIRTREDAPLSVSPPMLTPLSPSAIRANWSAPEMSNGEILRYRLSMDDAVVYEGLDMEHTVDSLVPYQQYTFFLTACTQGGCTDSDRITGRPEDSPPTDMDAPLLRVVSSSAIEVSWSAPTQPNGVISSYDVRRDGNLIFTDSITPDGVLVTVYTDYELQPGEEYTYTIIARNRKGSVESPPSKGRTYSTSPSGLDPPTLTPSSTSVQASWLPPLQPNGQIVNYTLYLANTVVCTGPSDQRSCVVSGLSFFTPYTFRLQACTERGCELSLPTSTRTLEAPPEQLGEPSLMALADALGAHDAVRATWQPPARPNGVVLHYRLQRRTVTVSQAGNSYGSAVTVYNGTAMEYTDRDEALLPFRSYQYMVMAINSAGQANSPWADVTTRQGPPTFVDPPVIVSTSATTITVTVTPPQQPNGVIRLYSVRVNGTVQASGLSLQLTAGEATPLAPYTPYQVSVEACTGGGCTNSSSVEARTGAARPAGLEPLTVVSGGVNSTAITLAWEPPSRPNGEIIRFLVYQRQACPPTDQPFPQTCAVGETEQVYQGLDTSTVAGGLNPYTAYQYMVQVENEVGQVDFPQWVRATTASADPVYMKRPTLSKNGWLAVIDWTGCFQLNGQLREYLLRVDSELKLRNTSTVYSALRSTDDALIRFEVEAVTDVGQVVSPVIIFDPNAFDNQGTTKTPVTAPPVVLSKPWYEEVWFIIVVVIVFLLLLFLIFAVCLRRSSPKDPYVRERMPLPPDQYKMPLDLYVIDAHDGSVIDATISPTMSGSGTLSHGPGVGMINPAFDPTLPRLQTLSIGPGSKSSLRALDDDDIDNINWDRNFDSGLFEDDDIDSLNNPAYSYTKEQTVFTDTHL
ncbi:usherin-like [Babylonia areolata]|uniref:usherin-like n=1 Tax=Babylonia areolata TaxID=304850 RepID=UPI003FD39F8D